MFYIYLGNNLIYRPLEEDLVLLNPRLTLEMGKAGSLEFSIPPTNSYYDQLTQLSSQIRVELDDDEIFDGRVLTNELQFNNCRKIYCEGDLAYLVDSVQKGEKYEGKTHALFQKIITAHNARVEASKQFTVGNITVTNQDIILTGRSDDNVNVGDIDYEQIAIDAIADEWKNTYEYIQNCLIDYEGGYLRTRKVNGVRYIDYLKDYFSDNSTSQTIELGQNLLDLTEKISAEELFTVLIPLGDDNLTIESVNDGSDELVDATAVSKYGRIVRTHVFSNVNNASTLLENGQRYLQKEVNIPRTVTVTAVDLHMVNPNIVAINLGDRIRVRSDPHNVDDYLVCTKIEYDLTNPANNKYTFGNPQQTLTDRYKEDQRRSNDTYGNSSSSTGSSYGGVGKVAAAAAEKVAEKVTAEQEVKLKSFYDAWIDIQPEQGSFSLRTVFEQVAGDRTKLRDFAGIDLDSNDCNSYINIKTFHNEWINNNTAVQTRFAGIDVRQNDSEAAIQANISFINGVNSTVTTNRTEFLQKSTELESLISSNTERINTVNGALNTATTEILQRVTDDEARIESNASFITQVNDELTEAKTSITQRVSATEASITQQATFNTIINGKVEANTASITTTANDLGSRIDMKADETYVDTEILKVTGDIEALDGTISALNGRFENLVTGKTRATKIMTDNLSVYNAITFGEVTKSAAAGYGITLDNHSHTFTELGDGRIQCDFATPSTTKGTFRIASTNKFKAGVEAVKLTSIALDISESNPTRNLEYNASTGKFTVPLKGTVAGTDDDTSFYTSTTRSYNNVAFAVEVDAARAINNVKPINIVRRTNLATGSEMPDTWNNGTGTIYLRATTNNSSYYYDKNITITNTSPIYTGIRNTVTISSLVRYQDDYYNSSTHKYTVYARATASNDKTKDAAFIVDASSVYTAGRNSIGIKSIAKHSYNASGDYSVAIDNSYVRYNSGNIVGRANITLDNDTSKTLVVQMAGDRAYDAGANTIVADAPSVKTQSDVHSISDGHHMTKVIVNSNAHTVKADGTTQITKSKDGAIYARADAVYNAVTISSLVRYDDDYYNSSTHKYTVYARATASNDKTKDAAFIVDASAVYTAGQGSIGIKSVAKSSYSSSGDYTVTIDNSYVRYNSGNIVGRASITLDNNTSKTLVVQMAGDRAYSAGETAGYSAGETDGKTAGANSVTINQPYEVENNNQGWHDNEYYLYTQASGSNGKTSSEKLFKINATPRYNAGVNAANASFESYKETYKYSYSDLEDAWNNGYNEGGAYKGDAWWSGWSEGWDDYMASYGLSDPD